MKGERICIICNGRFEGYHNAKLCSRSCRLIWQARRKKQSRDDHPELRDDRLAQCREYYWANRGRILDEVRTRRLTDKNYRDARNRAERNYIAKGRAALRVLRSLGIEV
jgi:hypothetical protein